MKEFIIYLKNDGIIQFMLIISSFFLGLKIPDWDIKLKLRHRSIVTHSPLITLIMIVCYNTKTNDYVFRNFIIGFSLGVAVHIIFDLFPKKWHGGALLKIPINNITLNKQNTRCFFYFTIIFSIFVAIIYTKNIFEYIFLLILSLATIINKSKHEKHIARPFFILLFSMIFFGMLKYKSIYILFLDFIKS